MRTYIPIIAIAILLLSFKNKPKKKNKVYVLVDPETFNPFNNYGFGYPKRDNVLLYRDYYYKTDLHDIYGGYEDYVNANGGFKLM